MCRTLGSMLSRSARRLRGVAATAALALLLAGSISGSDDDFPFGPFRMYAGVNDPNGAVNSTTLQAVLPDGRVVTVDQRSTGFRRADLEGQIDAFRANPGLLAAIAAAHDRLHPDEPRYVELRVNLRQYPLHHGTLGAATDTVLASWRSP